MSNKTTVWVTRWALTKGILKVKAEIDGGMASWASQFGREYAHGKDWHRTESNARKRVEEMRKNKIRSLRASIGKITDLKVKVVDR